MPTNPWGGRLLLILADLLGLRQLPGEQVGVHRLRARDRTPISGVPVALPGEQPAGVELFSQGSGPLVGRRRVAGSPVEPTTRMGEATWARIGVGPWVPLRPHAWQERSKPVPYTHLRAHAT